MLHVTHSGVASGGEIALSRLACHLQDQGLVHNVVACGAGGGLAESLRPAGVPVVVVGLPRSLAQRRRAQMRGLSVLTTLPATALYAVRIGRAARSVGADVIHTNSMKAHVGGMVAGWFLRVPVIVHLHDDLTQVRAGRLVTTVLQMLLRRVPRAVVGCSRHVIDAAVTGDVPTAVVYSGIPAEMVNDGAPPPKGEPVVGMVARIAEWKGQHLFLDAAEIIAKAEPRARFRIVGAPLFGEEALLDRLRRRAEQGVLAGRVEFTGFNADIAGEYDRMSVAVACSIEPEPFGQVVVEAMARGCAVVAPAEGGPLEVITHEVDGLLVPPRNADALAAAVMRLLGDQASRSMLGARATETVKARFTIDVTADAFLDLLGRVHT